MSKIITLRKGLDINLRGKAQESLADAPLASEYALSPLDFEGVTPKLLVKEGDRVKAGTPLFQINPEQLQASSRRPSAVRLRPSTAARSARFSP